MIFSGNFGRCFDSDTSNLLRFLEKLVKEQASVKADLEVAVSLFLTSRVCVCSHAFWRFFVLGSSELKHVIAFVFLIVLFFDHRYVSKIISYCLINGFTEVHGD